jgi:hypothetical protein
VLPRLTRVGLEYSTQLPNLCRTTVDHHRMLSLSIFLGIPTDHQRSWSSSVIVCVSWPFPRRLRGHPRPLLRVLRPRSRHPVGPSARHHRQPRWGVDHPAAPVPPALQHPQTARSMITRIRSRITPAWNSPGELDTHGVHRPVQTRDQLPSLADRESANIHDLQGHRGQTHPHPRRLNLNTDIPSDLRRRLSERLRLLGRRIVVESAGALIESGSIEVLSAVRL